jgi:hypothetical protein
VLRDLVTDGAPTLVKHVWDILNQNRQRLRFLDHSKRMQVQRGSLVEFVGFGVRHDFTELGSTNPSETGARRATDYNVHGSDNVRNRYPEEVRHVHDADVASFGEVLLVRAMVEVAGIRSCRMRVNFDATHRAITRALESDA